MRAVVFDMDGILFDTERLCLEGWRAVARANGFTGVEEIFPKCVGLSEKDCKRVVTQDLGEDFDYPRFSQKVSSWMRQYIAEYGLPVMKGAEHLLEWLEAEEWKIGLASSTRYDSVVRHLERSGLRHYFSQLTTGDMVEHSKPQPDIYLLACRHMGVEPGETYAIEDSPNGIRAAHGAGMIPLMVPDMIAPDEEMRRLSREIFGSLEDVLAYLQREET